MRHSVQRAASKMRGTFMKGVLVVTMNAEGVLDHEGHSSDDRDGARFSRFCIGEYAPSVRLRLSAVGT